MRILLAAEHYPCSIARFWKRGLRRLPGVEVVSMGHCTGGRISWGDYDLSRWADVPDYPLPDFRNVYDLDITMQRVINECDLFINVDAAHWFRGRAGVPKVIIGTDPHCAAGDTVIGTVDGPTRISDALGNTRAVWSRSGLVDCGEVANTKYAPAVTVENAWGMRLRCSADHRVEVYEPSSAEFAFKAAGALQSDDWLVVRAGCSPIPEGDETDWDFGLLAGSFDGNGNFGDRARHGLQWTVHRDNAAFLEHLRDIVKRRFPGHYGGRLSGGIYPHPNSDKAVVYKLRNRDLYAFLSAQCKTNHAPPFLWRSRRALAGYMNGLFSTDGCLNFINSIHHERLRELQLLMLGIGIFSRLSGPVERRAGAFPNGKPISTLSISSGQSRARFAALIGTPFGKVLKPSVRERDVFAIPVPQVLLDRYGREGARVGVAERERSSLKRLMPHLRPGTPPADWYRDDVAFVQVKSVTTASVHEPMYDVVNSADGTFLANGISVHNCLDYSRQRQDCDLFVCMQNYYSKPGDAWIPYAYDPEWHHYVEMPVSHDATFWGVVYENRRLDFEAMRAAGLDVHVGTGRVFSECVEDYCGAPVAYCTPSLQDLPARFFEAMAYGCVPVLTPCPDLSLLPFQQGVHYELYAPGDRAGLVAAVRRVLADPDREDRQTECRGAVADHTWESRADFLLQLCDQRGLVKWPA